MSTGTLGGVDDLVGEAFREGLHGSEGVGSNTLQHQVNALVDSSKRGDIDSLSSNGTSGSNSGGVFSGSSLGDGVNEDLDWVLTGGEVDDVKGLLDMSHGQLLFTVVSSLHHDGVDESLDNGAVNFLKTSFLVLSSGVWDEDLTLLGLDIQVGIERDVFALHSFIRILSEKFCLNSVFGIVVILNFDVYKRESEIDEHLLSA